MIGAPDMRSPAPRANAENRAEVIRNGFPSTIACTGPEAFAALYIARRYRLFPCLAQIIAALANLGGRIG